MRTTRFTYSRTRNDLEGAQDDKRYKLMKFPMTMQIVWMNHHSTLLYFRKKAKVPKSS